MTKPKTYDVYKKDKGHHRYEYTSEAHQTCIAYEQYLIEQFQKMDIAESEFKIKIKYVNNVIVSIESPMTMAHWIGCMKFINRNL